MKKCSKLCWIGGFGLFFFLLGAAPSTRPTTSQTQPLIQVGCLKIKPHTSYRMQHQAYHSIQQTAFGNKGSKVEYIIRWGHTLRYHSHSKRSTTLSLRYDFLRFGLRIGRYFAEYDSRKPSKIRPPYARYYLQFVGHQLNLKMDAQGRLLRVDGIKALHARLKKAVHQHPAYAKVSPQARKQMTQKVLQRFSAAQMHAYWGSFWSYIRQCSASTRTQQFGSFPIYGMHQKESWKRIFTDSKRELQLKAQLSKPQHTITPFGMGASQRLKYRLTGKRMGHIQLDRTTGLPRGGSIQTSINGSIYLRPAPQSSNLKKVKGKSWPVYVQNLIRFYPPITRP